jgi:hypothetical protein
MKYPVYKYLLISLAVFTISCEQSDVVLDSGDIYIRDITRPDYTSMELIADWNFDDETCDDDSGYEHHGTLMSPENAEYVDGMEGKAIYLDALTGDNRGAWIDIPMIDFELYSEFGMELWVKNESMGDRNGQMLLCFGDLTAGWLGLGHHTQFPNPDYTPVYHFSTGSYMNDIHGYSFKTALETDKVPFGKKEWVKLSMVYSKSTIYGYINDSLFGSIKQDINVFGDNAAIAKHYWGKGTGSCRRFTGIIDEVKVYGRKISLQL